MSNEEWNYEEFEKKYRRNLVIAIITAPLWGPFYLLFSLIYGAYYELHR